MATDLVFQTQTQVQLSLRKRSARGICRGDSTRFRRRGNWGCRKFFSSRFVQLACLILFVRGGLLKRIIVFQLARRRGGFVPLHQVQALPPPTPLRRQFLPFPFPNARILYLPTAVLSPPPRLLSWASSSDDLDYFEFTNNGTISTTTATSTNLTPSRQFQQFFFLSVLKISPGWSTATTVTAEISTMPVVINEVAWSGNSAAYYNDEWIELYNRTGKSINLANWILYSATDLKPYITLSGAVPAREAII